MRKSAVVVACLLLAGSVGVTAGGVAVAEEQPPVEIEYPQHPPEEPGYGYPEPPDDELPPPEEPGDSSYPVPPDDEQPPSPGPGYGREGELPAPGAPRPRGPGAPPPPGAPGPAAPLPGAPGAELPVGEQVDVTPPELPVTGARSLAMAGGGLMLIGLGLVAWLLAGRRRPASDS